MTASAALALAGVLLLLVQHVWAPGEDVPMPWHLAPLLLGSTSLTTGLMVGLVLGSRLYRIAVVIAISGLICLAVSFVRGIACCAGGTAPPSPDIFLVAAIALGLSSVVIAGLAIGRGRQGTESSPGGV